MTASTYAPAARPPCRRRRSRPGFGGAVRSEWTKIRTVRSTYWTLIAAMAVTIGLSTLIAWGNANHDTVAQLKTRTWPSSR